MSLTKTMKKIIRHKNEHCMSSNLATPPEKTLKKTLKNSKLFEIGSIIALVDVWCNIISFFEIGRVIPH